VGFDPSRFPPVEVGERRPAPQRQRLTDQVRGAVRRTHRVQFAPSRVEVFEALGVDLIARDDQAIPARHGLDRTGSQGPSEPHHRRLDLLVPRRRWAVTPQRLGQRCRVDHVAMADGQGRQDHTVARRERSILPADRQRPQDGDPHVPKSYDRVDTGQPRAYRAHTGPHRTHTGR